LPKSSAHRLNNLTDRLDYPAYRLNNPADRLNDPAYRLNHPAHRLNGSADSKSIEINQKTIFLV
jgi:hypothetical protein